MSRFMEIEPRYPRRVLRGAPAGRGCPAHVRRHLGRAAPVQRGVARQVRQQRDLLHGAAPRLRSRAGEPDADADTRRRHLLQVPDRPVPAFVPGVAGIEGLDAVIDLAVFYGRNNYLWDPSVGPVPGNVYATIVEGYEAFAAACHDVYRRGAKGRPQLTDGSRDARDHRKRAPQPGDGGRGAPGGARRAHLRQLRDARRCRAHHGARPGHRRPPGPRVTRGLELPGRVLPAGSRERAHQSSPGDATAPGDRHHGTLGWRWGHRLRGCRAGDAGCHRACPGARRGLCVRRQQPPLRHGPAVLADGRRARHDRHLDDQRWGHRGPVPGCRPRLGTNPISVAVPCGEEPPFVLDMATTAAAMGKTVNAQRDGLAIPAEWAYGTSGAPTTDPQDAMDAGRLLPWAARSPAAPTRGMAWRSWWRSCAASCRAPASARCSGRTTWATSWVPSASMPSSPSPVSRSMMDALVRELRATPPAAGFERGPRRRATRSTSRRRIGAPTASRCTPGWSRCCAPMPQTWGSRSTSSAEPSIVRIAHRRPSHDPGCPRPGRSCGPGP